MNRMYNAEEAQNQGWVTLGDRQLRRIEGGTEQVAFNFTRITDDYAPSQPSSSTGSGNYYQIKLRPVYVTSYQ